MKLGSLFDGSGTCPLAASTVGITPVWASEVEPYPISVTRSRFPNMKHLGSVTDIKGGDIEPVDIITFGSPCQDLSVAGKRAGLKHEANGDEETTRSGLFMEAVRIIKEMRKATNGEYPTFAVWENVPGAFSSNKGEDFRTVLEELIKIVDPTAVMPAVPKNGWPYADSYIGDGWSLAYRVLDAQYWGVPQRRRRIYLVFDLRGKRAGKILFEREGLRRDFAKSRTPWKAVAAHAERSSVSDDRARAYRIGAYYSAGMMSSNPKAGIISTDISATLDCNGGSPASQQGGVCIVEPVPYTLKIRSGCEGGGKGALVQEDKSAKLATNNDQYLFQPIIAAGFKAGNGEKARSIGYEEEKSHTLASEAGGNSVQSVCVKCYDARGNGDGKTVSTLTGDHENRITDYTSVVCMAHGQANAEILEDEAPCLNCNHEQPIVFGKEVYNSGVNVTGGHYIAEGGPSPTLRTSGPPGVCVQYIVRRLTPTECARLQGFPDKWGHPDHKEDFTDEEYRFWLDVRNTHAAINSKPQRDYSKDQMLTWYNKLHTDSSEYKMWGNGMELPCMLYIMKGVREVLAERYLKNLFGGDVCSHGCSKVQAHMNICNEINRLYDRKNHDYGDSFHQTFVEEGMAMARIRLGDKFNRFKTLSRGGDQKVNDESIRDTLIDLANYAIMTVLEMEVAEDVAD